MLAPCSLLLNFLQILSFVPTKRIASTGVKEESFFISCLLPNQTTKIENAAAQINNIG